MKFFKEFKTALANYFVVKHVICPQQGWYGINLLQNKCFREK